MKYLMTAMMSLFLMATAVAQEKKGETTELKSRSEILTERMTTELDLNVEQTKEVEVINAKYAEAALGRASAKADQETRSGDPVAMQEMNNALKAVLTPEQFAKWINAQKGGAKTTPDGRTINAVEEVK